jgi:EAL and modified HD-GYP domain-containing signal transduction protein
MAVLVAVLAVVAVALAVALLVVARRAKADRARAAAEGVAQSDRIAALERAADDLRASEASYRALVDAAPDWIWTCDPDGNLTFSNPAGEALLGHADLDGRALADLTHAEDRPALRADGWSGVVRRLHADGTWRTVETSSIPVRDGEGRLVGWRGIDRDLTPAAPPAAELPERLGVAIVRWPVVDGRRDVVAYELVGDGSVLEGYPPADLLELGGGRAIWLDAPPAGIPELPPDRAVLQIHPDTDAERAEALHRAGFTVAIDDYDGGGDALLPHCGVVKVRAPGREDDELQALIAEPASRGLELVATGVGSHEELQRCRVLGFSHFQGEFFTRPRGGGGAPQGAFASLHALGELTTAGSSFENIERVIGADIGLSLGLLRYVNSAYFALPRRIDTVREALTLLGTRAVRRWATVMALSAVPDAPDQLVALALLRGRMCELLGRGPTDEERDRLFTVGLLSVADALLDAPMEEVLESLPLSEEITGALLRHEGRRGRVLATVLGYEQGHFPEGADADPTELADAYLAALRWADEAGRWIGE